jgi:hypothetical protein
MQCCGFYAVAHLLPQLFANGIQFLNAFLDTALLASDAVSATTLISAAPTMIQTLYKSHQPHKKSLSYPMKSDSSHDEILFQNYFIIKNSGFIYSFSYIELTLFILSAARLRVMFDWKNGIRRYIMISGSS